MKKILITVLCILVFALILILLIVNFSSLGHDKSIRTARETFQKNNKDVEITDIQSYYGDQAYYIVFYKKNNIEFVGVLNKSYTKILEVEKSKLFNLEENSTLGYKDEKLSKQGLHAQYGYGNTSTIETQRRYINIEDITQMKNNTFYHNLIEKLNNQNSRNDKRIIIEDGFIELYKREDMFKEDKTNDSFFMINDKYIWYDKNILQGDIDLMAQMACKIKVIGYTVSCLEKEQKVVKAIAIFIE